MAITTPIYPESLALSANSTASSWGSLAGSATLPTGLQNVPGAADNLFIQPVGAGSDNQTFDFRIVGVQKIRTATGGFEYRKTVIAQFACTLCGDVGDSGRVVVNTQRYVDTITQTFGVSSTGVVSPGNDVRGFVIADLIGFEFFYLDFKVGTATSANAVIRTL